MRLAPVLIFVYNRIDHTHETICALLNNYWSSETEVIIFSDGYKGDDDKDEVFLVRSYIKDVKGFKRLSIVEREFNLGLADSIIQGVTEVLATYGKVIVLEDDIITSKYFLQYMNEALNVYEVADKVKHVSAYLNPIGNLNEIGELFFLTVCSCWGWGTWKRAWDEFSIKDSLTLFKLISGKKDEFDFGGTGAFWPQLVKNKDGFLKTWQIKWQANVFLNSGLALHPKRSLTRNIGFDNSGTNCDKNDLYANQTVSNEPIVVDYMPPVLSSEMQSRIAEFLRETTPKSDIYTLKYRSMRLLKRVPFLYLVAKKLYHMSK